MQQQLPNGCWRSQFSVNPSNWDKAGASCRKDWYIQYYFHDPSFADDPKLKYGRLRIIKGMNKFKTLAERREAVKLLMEEEDRLLTEEGYNPITCKLNPPLPAKIYVIAPDTPLLAALQSALDKHKGKCSESTHDDLRLVLEAFKPAAKALGLDRLQVNAVSRAHIRAVLDYHADHRSRWSANQWNHHRRYLMMLFSELMELEAVGANPVQGIRKMKTVRQKRLTLTLEERARIDAELAETHPAFRNYVHCFFHLGGRGTEIQRVQGKDVDLARGRISLLVLKGREYVRTWRPLKDVVIPFWEAALAGCGAEQYVFGVQFLPADAPMREERPTKTWLKYVKKPLSIEADIYSLKHSNSDETAALADLATAAAHNGQVTKVIELYAQGEEERKLERLRKVGNKFA